MGDGCFQSSASTAVIGLDHNGLMIEGHGTYAFDAIHLFKKKVAKDPSKSLRGVQKAMIPPSDNLVES